MWLEAHHARRDRYLRNIARATVEEWSLRGIVIGVIEVEGGQREERVDACLEETHGFELVWCIVEYTAK